MSQLQIAESSTLLDGSDLITATVSEIEETRSESQRKALYESLRQRDAWLRKAWGRASHTVVELQ